jgi:hypothetical protein
MTVPVSFKNLEARLHMLDCTTPDCREQISSFRQDADAACDNKQISLKEWRNLVLQLSPIQEKCLTLQPDAWRFPLPRGKADV